MVDKAVSTSYEYLVGKLGTVFPQLRAGAFSLTWTDGDGDKVKMILTVFLPFIQTANDLNIHIARFRCYF